MAPNESGKGAKNEGGANQKSGSIVSPTTVTNDYRDIHSAGFANQLNGPVGGQTGLVGSTRENLTAKDNSSQLNGALNSLPKGFFHDRTGGK